MIQNSLEYLRRNLNWQILSIFLLAFSVTLYAGIVFHPVGADIQFHLEIARTYLHGENGMFAPFVMEINRMPYPFFFHFMLLPSVALNLYDGFIRFLQILSYPCALLFAMVLAKRYGKGTFHAVIVGLALIGSAAYLDLTFQIRPETLDAFLWLGLTFAFLSERKWLQITSGILGAYSHGLASLAVNGGQILYGRNKRTILIVTLACLPIVLISLFYVVPMFSKWVGVPVSSQARMFLTDWPAFTFSYLGALSLGLPVVFWQIKEWKTQTLLTKLSIVTLASSLLLLPIWYDRYYHYAAIPLAFCLGDFACSHKKLAMVIMAFIIYFFVLGYLHLWLVNILGLWDVH